MAVMRRHLTVAAILIAASIPSVLVAAEAPRAELVGRLCGDTAAIGEAARALTALAQDG
ncbi:MAG: hypothetical protein JWQ94_2837, partial [Tardiphaga sp.]|nr:hypothetical protein [Tardiphaga sp.]